MEEALQSYEEQLQEATIKLEKAEKLKNVFYPETYLYKYWNKAIHTDPNQLIFWIDFLDTKGELEKYSIPKIGLRTKVVNDNKVTSLYNPKIPEVLFILPEENNQIDSDSTANTFIQIPENYQELFVRSTFGTSASERVDELVYQHVLGTESLSISAIPIYYLQPNTRIHIAGEGDYTITNISYQLGNSNSMSISGTKIVEQLI